MTLSLVIADDSDAVRRLLRLFFERESDFVMVGEASDGYAAAEIVCRLKPNLLLLDIAMPKSNGLQVLHEVRKCSPDTRIVIYSGFSPNDLAAVVLEKGASAYIVKGSPVSQLVDALRHAAAS